MRSVLLDTGPWLALFHHADRHHLATTEWLRREGSSVRLFSTWPVLTEVGFFLRAQTKQRLLTWVERGALALVDLDRRDVAVMNRLIGRFADQKPDLADASLLAIAERLGIAEVATFDRKDFSIYRIGRDMALRITDFEQASAVIKQRKR